MKATALFAAATLLAGMTYSTNAYAVNTDPSQNTLRIQLIDSKRFKDIDIGYGNHQKQAEIVMESVRKSFQRAADKYLPSGYTLEVQVRDIDLAGDRSHLTSTYGDIRVLRDLYPPRIAFDYTVYDSQERIVVSGSANETDLGYLQSFRGPTQLDDEKAPYIAELVRGWASKTLSKELRRAAN